MNGARYQVEGCESQASRQEQQGPSAEGSEARAGGRVPDRRKRMFVLDGETAAEHGAEVDELIRSGEARDTDWFICTGVRRSPGVPYSGGAAWDAT